MSMLRGLGSRRTVRVYVSAVLFLFSGVKTVMFFLCAVGPRQVMFAKKLLKNEVRLRWSVLPQWIPDRDRLWRQTSPQRIP